MLQYTSKVEPNKFRPFGEGLGTPHRSDWLVYRFICLRNIEGSKDEIITIMALLDKSHHHHHLTLNSSRENIIFIFHHLLKIIPSLI